MAKDILTLSVDTSSKRFSIALLENDLLIDEIESGANNSHSSQLIPEIDKMLLKNLRGIKDIDLFCVGLGPGSFTGLRIGLTIMRGFALSLKRPIIGIPSIDSLAFNVLGHQGLICPIIDAKQHKVYARFYECKDQEVRSKGKILLTPIADLLKSIKRNVIFLGDGLSIYKDDIISKKSSLAVFAPETTWYPKAAIIGRLGVDRFRSGGKDNVFNLTPLYIYPKECQVATRKQR
ncbi:tRNA (adenosine(37)-N6)-threonylcarbamoyltransferase complex dimerization subunit type 1 TsaB [Candidatus Omnitrophota bacterium]